jgi:pimeloyl-ACP methyl ester carboxylesterase
MNETTHTIDREGAVEVTVRTWGRGRPVLLLHGGAGPASIVGIATQLAKEDVSVIAPLHPGFDGTPRPAWLDGPKKLARVYAALLDELALDRVVVVGTSVGGWIASELALLASPRVASLVLIGAVGIHVEDHAVTDVFSLALPELMKLSYHDPSPFRVDPSTMSDAQRATFAANRAALAVYGGASMGDPTLRARLSAVAVPTLVLWGASDRIVDVDYGRALAAAIPGARFEVMPRTGHVPQIETPAQLLALVLPFVHATSE